ncbi:MAG: FAD-binding oxidoreductase [Acidobacteriaceae bacterium]|nr:FAD-binding oxidoreductase [Acidobacteriaceae bacterium]
MSVRVYDAVVVGAGIVGAACADRLSREHLNVAIVDRGLVGGGATAAGMGHIVTMDDSEAQFALTRFSQQLWIELRPELPADVEYRQCGTLWVAADEPEMQEVIRKHRYYGERGVATSILTRMELAELEPKLRPDMAGALLVPEDAVIYPPCAARFVVARAEQHGAETFLGGTVERIDNGSVLLTNGTRFSAGIVVNAAGIAAPALTSTLDIKPRKGHLVITDRYPDFVRHQIVELGYLKSAHSVTADSVAFNVQPRATGQMLIGSSRQYGADHSQVDDIILSRMLRRAFEYIPGLARTSALRAWTGFRAATPDKLPLIGPWPEDRRLLLATGHEGLGITTSLGTAALLADHVVGRTPRIQPEPFLPARTFLEHVHA